MRPPAPVIATCITLALTLSACGSGATPRTTSSTAPASTNATDTSKLPANADSATSGPTSSGTTVTAEQAAALAVAVNGVGQLSPVTFTLTSDFSESKVSLTGIEDWGRVVGIGTINIKLSTGEDAKPLDVAWTQMHRLSKLSGIPAKFPGKEWVVKGDDPSQPFDRLIGILNTLGTTRVDPVRDLATARIVGPDDDAGGATRYNQDALSFWVRDDRLVRFEIVTGNALLGTVRIDIVKDHVEAPNLPADEIVIEEAQIPPDVMREIRSS